MKHFQSFQTFSDKMRVANEERKIQEKSNQQKEYADFFLKLLQKYDVTSPDQLDDTKKEQFFADVAKGWSKDSGITTAGQEMIGGTQEQTQSTDKVSESTTLIKEEDIKSDDDFTSYAKELLKSKHGDQYDETKAAEVIKDLLAKKQGDDYGALVGMLQNS